ncbi:MAG: DUF1129 family protein [Lachnospiraceae bacterium]
MSRTARMLRKQNNEFEECLSEQNQDVMTDIVAYLRGANITETEQEHVRADISQMLFDAQERGETAQHVIGMDYKQFCDEILENVETVTGKEKVIQFFESMLMCVAVLIPVIVCFGVLKNVTLKQEWWRIEFSLGQAILYVGIFALSSGLVQYILHHSFEEENRMQKLKIFLVVVICLFVLLLGRVFLQNVLFSASLAVYGIVFVIALVGFWIMDWVEV